MLLFIHNIMAFIAILICEFPSPWKILKIKQTLFNKKMLYFRALEIFLNFILPKKTNAAL